MERGYYSLFFIVRPAGAQYKTTYKIL